MNRSILKCAIVGGVIVFIVNFLAWHIFPGMRSMQFQNESAVSHAISHNAPSDGLYMIHPSEGDCSHLYFYGAVQHSARYPMGVKIVLALIVEIIVAGLIAGLLLRTNGHTFGKKLSFVTLVGVIIAITSTFCYFNWAGFPFTWMIFCAVIQIVAWFLAGIAMAKLVRIPRK